MRRLTLSALVSLLLVAPLSAADAPTQVMLQVDVLSVSPAAASELHVGGREPLAQWQKMESSGTAKVVQTLEYIQAADCEAAMLVGHKDPIVFYDPRAQQFQIQYVDSGLKIESKIASIAPDAVKLDVQADFSLLELRRPYGNPPEPITFPQTSCMQSSTGIDALHYDEAAVICRAHGIVVKQFWKAMGVTSVAPENDLVVTISARRG